MICEASMGQPRHPRIKPLTVISLLADKPPEAYTVGPDMTLMEALNHLRENAVDALAVVDGQRLLGVFSQRSLSRKGLLATDLAPFRPLAQLMSACPIHATPRLEVQECLALMRTEQLDCIPVLEEGAVLGLLTLSELQGAIIAQYESIFKAAELDQRIMFLQGTYSC
jgi:CBS domain-containing protein